MAKEKLVTYATNEKILEELLNSNNIYEIPIYQRNFKWGKKKIDQVLDDFDQILDGQKDKHFFGATITYQVQDEESYSKIFEIIDGQQRMTTIFLFLLAYIYVLRKYNPTEAKYSFIQTAIDLGVETSNSRLRPSKEDRNQLNWIFEQITRSTKFQQSLEFKYKKFMKEPDGKEKGLLRSAWSTFRDYLEKKIKDIDDKEKGQELKNIYKTILGSCTVVDIRIQDRQNGPMIFDALNARQEQITVGELIKNALFARDKNLTISQMKQIHDAEWFPFQNAFLIDNRNLMEGYFFPFGLIGNNNLKKNEVYADIVSRWNNFSSSSEIINSLSEYQPSYIALNGGTREKYPKRIKESIKRIYEGGLPASCMPFFMQLLRKLEINPNFEDEAINIFSSLEAFLVRRAICNDEPTGLHAVFKKMWTDLDGSNSKISAESVMNYISKAKTVRIPEDFEFEKQIRENSLFGKKICRFMLYEYDKSLHGEVPDDEDVTIEHILPQNPANWEDKFTLAEHSKYVNTFANLVLITGKSNSTIGNKNYEDKKNMVMKNAKFKSTRDLFEAYTSWTPEDIENRSQELAKWALSRWKYIS